MRKVLVPTCGSPSRKQSCKALVTAIFDGRRGTTKVRSRDTCDLPWRWCGPPRAADFNATVALTRNSPMLRVHVLEELYHHSSNVAHGVEVPAGARRLFTNGRVGTKLNARSRCRQRPSQPLRRAELVVAPATFS